MEPAPLKAADTTYVAPRHVHEARNASATEPLEILVFAVHEKGRPLAVRVTEPSFRK